MQLNYAKDKGGEKTQVNLIFDMSHQSQESCGKHAVPLNSEDRPQDSLILEPAFARDLGLNEIWQHCNDDKIISKSHQLFWCEALKSDSQPIDLSVRVVGLVNEDFGLRIVNWLEDVLTKASVNIEKQYSGERSVFIMQKLVE